MNKIFRSIYWKIFLWFWVMMVVTVIIIGWLSLQFSQHNYLPLRQRNLISNYGVMAVITYQVGDKKALKKWFSELNHHFDTKAYLIDENGHDVLGQPLRGRMQEIARAIGEGDVAMQAVRKGDIVVSPIIQGNDNHEYRFVAKKELTLAALEYFHLSGFILGLLLAIVIAGLVCYFLSRYLMRPVRMLTKTAHHLGRGDLSVRVPKKVSHRRDELGDLADEFNNMADQIEQLVDAQRRLLQDVSHELRTPLARLQIALELARKKIGNQAERELERIELESERLNGLIGQILSLARMRSNEYQLLLEDLDLSQIIETIAQDISYEDSAKAARIKLDLDKPCPIRGDRKLLRSAVENILRNALRYAPEPTPVEVHLIHQQGMINISIRDHGNGVPEDKIQNLFKSFYRVDDARSKAQGGYGLGLAIAKRSVALHHGKISASNAIDGGLIVNIDLVNGE